VVIATDPLGWSLVDGWLPVAAGTLGLTALAAIGWSRRRRWWLWVVPCTVTGCLVVVAGIVLTVDVWWRPFPEPLPPPVVGLAGAGILATMLATLRCRSLPWRGRAGVMLAALLVALTVVTQTNVYFSAYPTLRAALGMTVTVVPFEQVADPAARLVDAPPGEALDQVWRAPPGLPEGGTVSKLVIPAAGDFEARPAWVYLPPAYQATPRPRLPVLVLLAGQPGFTTDWLRFGQLPPAMDQFASEHGGLAPVVVMPDTLGSPLANPLCLDSRLGSVETYLAVDVPTWIRAHLQVSEDPAAWAIGGFSQGGTCALQLAVRAPAVYSTFVSIAGQREPTLGDRELTVERAFGGDAAAFAEVNPLDVLADTRFPGTAGAIVAGRQDHRYHPDAREVLEACLRAGMDMHWLELPGGHNWAVWRPALPALLPWLARRLGLVR
jgi:S-formylglutathione hydrolase FrmB